MQLEDQNRIYSEYASQLITESQFNDMVSGLVKRDKLQHFERSIDLLEDTGNVDGVLDLIETTYDALSIQSKL